jgi:hypothetical protein
MQLINRSLSRNLKRSGNQWFCTDEMDAKGEDGHIDIIIKSKLFFNKFTMIDVVKPKKMSDATNE